LGHKISSNDKLSAQTVDALIKNEARFRTMFEAEPECVKTVDRNYKLLDMNPAGLTMIGAPGMKAVHGASVLDLVLPEYHEIFRSTVDAAFRGEATRVQFEITSLDGTRRFMEQSAAPMFDPSNPDIVLEMVAVTRDISEHKAVLDSLEEARAASQKARDGLQMEVDERLEDIRLIGELTKIINEHDEPDDVLQRLINRMCAGTSWKTGHVWLMDRDKKTLRSSGVWALNTPDHLLGFIADSRQSTYKLGKGLPGRTAKLAKPVFVTRNSGFKCPRFHLEGGQTLNTGCAFPIMSEKKVLGIVEFFSDQEMEHPEELIENFAHIGAQIGRVFERAEHQKSLAAAYSEMEQRVAERTVELVVATDQAQAGNRMKSDFLANMSHEIRTPMNGVLGMLQVLARTQLDRSQKQILETIEQSGQNLVTIIDDILDLSKIEAGSLDIEEVEFDIEQTVETCISLYAGSAAEKSLSLNTHIEPAASGVFLGDPFRIRQILNNLVSNALKFTEQGGVTISIASRDRGPDQCHQLEFSITDTGIGMTEAASEILFRPFTQADTSITRNFGGTGLGLAISQQLCGLMGGNIVVHSVPDEGSTFSFNLPLPRAECNKLESPEFGKLKDLTEASDGVDATENILQPVFEDSSAELDAIKPLHILAAEDVFTNQIILRSLIEPLCASLTIVENGQEALDHWVDLKPDLILMDMQMPVMDGLTAIKEIRRAETARQAEPIPIIALTANVMPHQLKDYAAAGTDSYVGKPFRLEQLIHTISGAVSQTDKSDSQHEKRTG
jgi:PAS domain S-box-containing protein